MTRAPAPSLRNVMSSRPTDAIPLALPGNARPPSSRRRWLGVRSYWLCQAAGWGGLLTLMAGPLPLKALASGAEFAALLLFCVTGLLLSHLLRVAITKALDASRTWGGLILRILPWFAFIPAVHAIIQVAWAKDVLPHSTAFMNSFPGRDPVLFAFVDIFSFSTGIFATWTGFYFGLIIQRHHHETRIDRLELAAHIQEAAWQELRAQLMKAGFKVFLTRTSDEFIELPDRPQIARRRNADLFVSLHFNSFPQPSARGAEVYCLTPAGAPSTNARGEGAGSGSSPGNRLNSKNMLLAYDLQQSLTRSLSVEDRGVHRARFAVLRDATMPAVLIEGGFMSHPSEGRKIFDAAYRREMARAITEGILHYKRQTEGVD